MPLEIAKVDARDFETMLEYTFNRGGDLIAPLVPLFWATSTDDEANDRRNRWSMKQQLEMFIHDPSTHFMKVVDTDRDNDIVAVARWHRYERGYQHPQFTAWELNGRDPRAEESWPAEINVKMLKAMLLPLFEARPQWQGQRPMWQLTTLITKEPQRRRGAGGMLVEWGVDQAKKENIPAFIEATPAGAPLYEKFGFKRVGEQVVDMQEFGFPEPLILARMAANMS